MPESESNLEFVEEMLHRRHTRFEAPAKWVEILEAVVLALVAVSTAWSGFQAARWSGLSAQQISLGLRTTMLAQEKATLAGQDRLYDVFAFNDWLEAKADRNEKLAAFYERRFRPEYATIFKAWLKLDPFHNRSVAPGPVFMREYTNENAQESAKLSEEAKGAFEKSVSMRATSEEYIRVTVFLATVLLLTAIGQRVQNFWPRAGIVVAAIILLGGSAYHLLTLPRWW